MQPAPDFKPMNVGLRKRLSFSAIRPKLKASLDILPFVAEETPLTNTFRNEITKTKQRKAAQLIFEMKERKSIINSTTEQF